MTAKMAVSSPFLPPEKDLWQHLRDAQKPIVLYGMGNGADKIIRAMEEKGLEVADFFASDGFVRGHTFHGKTVLSYSAVKEKYGNRGFIVLVSFASSLDEVVSRILAMNDEVELYIPEIPVVQNESATDAEPFDLDYYRAHEEDILKVDALFADDRSREVYRSLLRHRLTGNLSDLFAAVDDHDTVYRTLLHPETYLRYADLGAYNGDTVREILPYAKNLLEAYCMEPDPRNFRKLSEYGSGEERAKVIPLNFAAYSHRETLSFEVSGNRNATLKSGTPNGKRRLVEADALSNLLEGYGCPRIDYIKLDVEGAEREAIRGCLPTIEKDRPELLVSLYHRREDIFALPLLLKAELDARGLAYDLYLRRFRYFPAWDLNLYAVPRK